MPKMVKLTNEVDTKDFFNHIDGKELIIYEDIQGSRIYVKFTGDRFIIKPRSIKNDELSFVDLAIQKYYNKAYLFFHTLPKYITEMLNKNWWFCFEFLPDEKPATIEYSRIPKNNLVLTSIVKSGHHKFNYDEIKEYSNLFNVEPIPLIFKGVLNNKQLEVIRLFLNTNEDDLNYIFGEESFAEFFYKILNPNIEQSFLMNDEFNDNLEKIIIKSNGKDAFTFAVLNPLYKKDETENSTEHAHVYSLIIINFLEFLQLKKLSDYQVKGLTKDEIYINLISLMFNDYMKNMKDDINRWDFFIPNFIKEDKYKINLDLIKNKDTKRLVQSNEKLEYIFKIILGSFNKKRKKPIGIMKDSTVVYLNDMIIKIEKLIEKLLDINRDYRFQKIDLMNFNDYFNMKFDRDAAGNIYPDTSIQFDKGIETDITKDKKGKKGYTKKKDDEL